MVGEFLGQLRKYGHCRLPRPALFGFRLYPHRELAGADNAKPVFRDLIPVRGRPQETDFIAAPGFAGCLVYFAKSQIPLCFVYILLPAMVSMFSFHKSS